MNGIVDELRARWKAKREQTEFQWGRILVGMRQTPVVTHVLLVYARYTCGYLATGFLVSAPLQLVSNREWGDLFKSVILGGVFALPFLVLIPFTQLEWERMRLPSSRTSSSL